MKHGGSIRYRCAGGPARAVGTDILPVGGRHGRISALLEPISHQKGVFDIYMLPSRCTIHKMHTGSSRRYKNHTTVQLDDYGEENIWVEW